MTAHSRGAVSADGIALALSGGAARTIAHLGALRVLQRAGIPIACYAGTSGGALIAVLRAAGYPLVDLEREARGVEWRRLVEFRPHPLGILSTERLSDFVVRRIGALRFEELEQPCAVVATDLTAGEKRVFRSGPVARAVAASCAIPEFYRPVTIDGHTCIDGGIVEPLPVETAAALGAGQRRPLVACSVLGKRAGPTQPRHLWHLLGRITELVQYELARRSAAMADLSIEPEVGGCALFDLERADELLAAGARAMEACLGRLEALLAGRQPRGGGRARRARRMPASRAARADDRRDDRQENGSRNG